MAAHLFNAKTARVCGHEDLFGFSYGSKANRMSDVVYARATMCGECSQAIKALVGPQEKGFFRMELPELVGYPKHVSWAKSIRLAKIRKLGPVMAKLVASDDTFAPICLAVYVMLFKITSARYWIGAQHESFDNYWIVYEVERLMRERDTGAVRPSSLSAGVYWSALDVAPIREARQHLPNLDIVRETQVEVDASLVGPETAAHCA
jgi:hypothetical protein